MRSGASLLLLIVSVTGPASARAQSDASPPPELAASEGPSGTAGSGDERYDRVGLASASGDLKAGGIAAAHRTLPVGAIAEVTSLATGRIILVRIADRGPIDTRAEIDLTDGAAQLLGLTGTTTPVRVRAIAASGPDASALARGEPAAPRMDAPPVLLAALRRQLPASTVLRPKPTERAAAALPRLAPLPRPASSRPATASAATAVGRYVVQVAAFSTKDRATTVARTLAGSVLPGGALWRVRLGPYRDLAAAQRARDAAARRGYGDAQVLPSS